MAGLLFRVRPNRSLSLPGGGVIIAGLPHRNWVEPFLLYGLLPSAPVWIADRRTASTSRPRRWVARLAGGAIPVGGRGGVGEFKAEMDAVRRALAAGRSVVIFPEVGPPSAAPVLRRLSPGVAHLAAASSAPVVPVVFGGTEQLYLRRPIVVRLLPALDAPADTSRPKLAAFMDRLGAQAQSAATEAHEAAESSAPGRKRWRWLTGRYPRAG